MHSKRGSDWTLDLGSLDFLSSRSLFRFGVRRLFPELQFGDPFPTRLFPKRASAEPKPVPTLSEGPAAAAAGTGQTESKTPNSWRRAKFCRSGQGVNGTGAHCESRGFKPQLRFRKGSEKENAFIHFFVRFISFINHLPINY